MIYSAQSTIDMRGETSVVSLCNTPCPTFMDNSEAAGWKHGLVYLDCLEGAYTLRDTCERYIREGGAVLPDCMSCKLHGTGGRKVVMPLRVFNNNVGHCSWLPTHERHEMVCYPPRLHNDIEAMAEGLLTDMSLLSDGYL